MDEEITREKAYIIKFASNIPPEKGCFTLYASTLEQATQILEAVDRVDGLTGYYAIITCDYYLHNKE